MKGVVLYHLLNKLACFQEFLDVDPILLLIRVVCSRRETNGFISMRLLECGNLACLTSSNSNF